MPLVLWTEQNDMYKIERAHCCYFKFRSRECNMWSKFILWRIKRCKVIIITKHTTFHLVEKGPDTRWDMNITYPNQLMPFSASLLWHVLKSSKIFKPLAKISKICPIFRSIEVTLFIRFLPTKLTSRIWQISKHNFFIKISVTEKIKIPVSTF